MLDLLQGRKRQRSLAADEMRRVMCVVGELRWTAAAVAGLVDFDEPWDLVELVMGEEKEVLPPAANMLR
jgi:hypothetical protein